MYTISRVLSVIDWKLAITIGIPAAVTLLGWFLVNWLNGRRDMAIRKREARLKALEAAYMRLATSSNRPLTDEFIDRIETFVSEIQLYGTPRQIQLTTKIVEGFNIPNSRVPFDEILFDLRDTLRKELRFEPVSGPVWWLRLPRENKATNKPLNLDEPSDGTLSS